jgi:D-galactarolactone cycloisomerase
MKVTALDTYFLSAPLPQAVRTSTHRIASVSEVIVKLTTDAGLVGIGEAHGPFLFQPGPEGLRSVGDILRAITPLVVGQDPFDVERIWQDLFALTYTSVRGIPALARQQRPLVTAMSAIDIALWDLKGKAIGRPVWALLGGALRRRVPAYVTGFYYRDGERPDDLVREATMYVEQGYRTVKVKVGGLTPEADAERVGRIRKAVGKDVAIMLVFRPGSHVNEHAGGLCG